ncbi:hypothetical protein PENTCL1PPCAC_14136, partial [Pristionchus entomophagus]
SFKTRERVYEEAHRLIAFMETVTHDGDTDAESTIHLYDPITNEWTFNRTPKMPNLDGSLAVIGRNVYFIGGLADNVDSTEYRHKCLVFDSQANEWSETSPMHDARRNPAVGVIDGKIYAAGGNVTYEDALGTMETYNPLDDQPEWSASKSMIRKRSWAASCVLDGKLYVLGGCVGDLYWNDGECYDPETDSWTLIAPLNKARNGFKAASLNGHIYAVGETTYGDYPRSDVERYDTASDTWTTLNHMNLEGSIDLVVCCARLFAVKCYWGNGHMISIAGYQSESNTWSTGVLPDQISLCNRNLHVFSLPAPISSVVAIQQYGTNLY